MIIENHYQDSSSKKLVYNRSSTNVEYILTGSFYTKKYIVCYKLNVCRSQNDECSTPHNQSTPQNPSQHTHNELSPLAPPCSTLPPIHRHSYCLRGERERAEAAEEHKLKRTRAPQRRRPPLWEKPMCTHTNISIFMSRVRFHFWRGSVVSNIVFGFRHWHVMNAY